MRGRTRTWLFEAGCLVQPEATWLARHLSLREISQLHPGKSTGRVKLINSFHTRHCVRTSELNYLLAGRDGSLAVAWSELHLCMRLGLRTRTLFRIEIA